MKTTNFYDAKLMETHYAINAQIGLWVWFKNYKDAHQYFTNTKFVDYRIAEKVICPTGY